MPISRCKRRTEDIMLKKNQTVTLDVIDINHLGFGVAKPDGFAVFVSGGVPGDRVKATVIKVNRSYAVAKLDTLLTPSAHRAKAPRCPIHACTACAYKAVDYAYEVERKHASVVHAFRKAGLSQVTVAPLLTDGKTHHYRNKAQYPVARDKDGGYRIGFFAPKSHRVCEAAACPLQPSVFEDILACIRAYLVAHGISVYDEACGEGLLRHIYLRRGERSGEILLTLVVTDAHLPYAEELVGALTERFPAIVGILLNVQKEDTNVILGDTYHTLFGRDTLTDTLAGVTLSLSAPSFYQVNHDMAERLYEKARELAAPTGEELLLDLFCGVGSIGLSMAHEVRELIGIEIVEDAVRCAARNAEQSGITNARFFSGDASDADALLARAEAALGHPLRPDIVILDPPRKGCTERLLTYVASLSPSRIVYISCNPETLARDCAILAPLGYTPGVVTPVDLFPGTGHVESVVCLKRQIQQ